jgi:hypothetical protein
MESQTKKMNYRSPNFFTKTLCLSVKIFKNAPIVININETISDD